MRRGSGSVPRESVVRKHIRAFDTSRIFSVISSAALRPTSDSARPSPVSLLPSEFSSRFGVVQRLDIRVGDDKCDPERPRHHSIDRSASAAATPPL